MALFDFLRRRPDEPQEMPTHEVTLEELPEWFEQAMGERIREKRKEAQRRHDEVADRFSEVRARLDALDRARVSGGERVLISANMIKEGFVKKKYPVLRSLDSFREGSSSTFRYFNAFQERSLQAVRELKDSTPKQGILLSRYFKRESQELVESIKRAEDSAKDLREFLEEGSGPLDTLNRIRRSISEVKRLREEAAAQRDRARALEEDARKAGERKAELERRFLKLLKSRDWNRLNRLEGEVSRERATLRELESRLNTELSSIKREAKKVDQALSRKGKLSPIHRNSVRDFVRDPQKAVMFEKSEKAFLRALKAAQKPLEKSDADPGGMIEKITGPVSGMRSELLDQEDRVRALEKELKELSRLSKAKDGMEAEIRRVSEEKGRIEEELGTARSKGSELEREAKETIRELERSILEDAQRRVIIRERPPG